MSVSSRFIPRLLLFAAAAVSTSLSYGDQTLPLDPEDSSFHFIGDSFLHTFHGEAKVIAGSAILNPSAAPPIQSARLSFRTAELTTFNDERDAKMKDWMQIPIHPDVDFTLEKVTPVSGDYRTASSHDPARFAVSGTLTLNAVKQRISGEALGWREHDRLVVTGDIVVNTLNFGLPQIRMLVITVAPDVKTSYRFSFKLPPQLALK